MTSARRALVLALFTLGAVPAAASAGTYDVYSCTLPNGSPAPMEGWRSDKSSEPRTLISNTCAAPAPGAFGGALGDRTVSYGRAGWFFTAPRSTTISNFTLFRTVHMVTGSYWSTVFAISYGVRGAGVDAQHFAEFCTPWASCWDRGSGSRDPFAVANRVSASGLEVPQVIAEINCKIDAPATSCDPGSDHGWFEIYSARFGLSDPYEPAFVSPPVGPLLATDAPLEGEQSLRFSTTDRGSGIEKVGVAVDGALRLARPAIDPAASRCRRPFVALVPCPLSVNTTIAFDTAALPNGPHAIQASVIDASGNETRSDPVVVTTRNGSRPNGRGASRFVKLAAWLRSRRAKQRASAVVPYGSVRTAEGRLTDAEGKPIGGAVLDVVANVDRPGAKDKRAGTVTTRDDGRYSYRIGRGPSRELRFEYKAYTLDPAPVSSAKVTLGVRAGFRLKLAPRKVRNGQRVTFQGRLKGGPARKGTRVTIDVLVPDARRRVPIGNVRADAKGRFRFSYRFRRTLVKARYRFQARLVAQPGYPYRGATSRRVSVVVSP